jgi:hypothetical protein
MKTHAHPQTTAGLASGLFGDDTTVLRTSSTSSTIGIGTVECGAVLKVKAVVNVHGSLRVVLDHLKDLTTNKSTTKKLSAQVGTGFDDASCFLRDGDASLYPAELPSATFAFNYEDFAAGNQVGARLLARGWCGDGATGETNNAAMMLMCVCVRSLCLR